MRLSMIVFIAQRAKAISSIELMANNQGKLGNKNRKQIMKAILMKINCMTNIATQHLFDISLCDGITLVDLPLTPQHYV